jgi:hypothetical protein
MLPWQLYQEPWALQGNSVVSPNGVRIKVNSAMGTPEYRLEQGNENPPAGWQSLYYGHKDPAPVFSARGRWDLPVRFFTGVWLGSGWNNFDDQDNTVTWQNTAGQIACQAVFEPLTDKELPVLKQLSIAGKAIHLS